MSSIKVINTIRLCSKGVLAKDANGKYVKLHKRQGDMDGAEGTEKVSPLRLYPTLLNKKADCIKHYVGFAICF